MSTWAPAWLPLCRNENISSQKKTHLRYNSRKIRNRPFDSRHANKSSSGNKNQLCCRRDKDSESCCKGLIRQFAEDTEIPSISIFKLDLRW